MRLGWGGGAAQVALVRCDMAEVRSALGLSCGGRHALVAMAQLTGGDYDRGGADNVGGTMALRAIKALLGGKEVFMIVISGPALSNYI